MPDEPKEKLKEICNDLGKTGMYSQFSPDNHDKPRVGWNRQWDQAWDRAFGRNKDIPDKV